MLNPARVLRDGRIALDVGSAYNAPVWVPSAGNAARAEASTGDVLAAAAAQTAAPGVLSYVAARGGFGGGNEGTIALVGRVLRIGVRRELWTRGTNEARSTFTGALAVRGAPFSGAYAGATSRVTVQDARLLGGELTIAYGLARRDTYDLWLGLRGGYTWNAATLDLAPTATEPDMRSWSLAVHRVEAGLHLGMRVGFGRVGAAVELEAAFAYAFGTATSSTSTTTPSGASFALVPAGALSYNF